MSTKTQADLKQYEKDIDFVKTLLEGNGSVVVLTGAGISTESGLKDFRGVDGMWKGRDPFTLASIEAMDTNKEEFIEFYAHRIEEVQKHRHNTGHCILSGWLGMRFIDSIITQNVDPYHQEAYREFWGRRHEGGEIIGVHGNLSMTRCSVCRTYYPSESYSKENHICKECGGFLRPNVILMGESLGDITSVVGKLEKAQAIIAIGTSLSVSPIADLVIEAYKNGTSLIIINREETSLDALAVKVINEKGIGEVLGDINERIGHKR